jgi:hypothetical protein
MTNEEKLLKLLQVAVENGWKNYIDLDPCYLNLSNIAKLEIIVWDNYGDIHYSLNDLICNWEEGEVSFVEALCNADLECVNTFNDFALGIEGYGSPYLSACENIILFWDYDYEKRKLRPTSQRLEWLFETFKHLL